MIELADSSQVVRPTRVEVDLDAIASNVALACRIAGPGTKVMAVVKADADKRAALTSAVRELRAEYPHPYYWAPFVLIGDAGRGAISTAGTTSKAKRFVHWTPRRPVGQSSSSVTEWTPLQYRAILA